MLINKFFITITLLIFISIGVRHWFNLNGTNYKKDKKSHATLSILRGCVFVLVLYVTITTVCLESKLKADVPTQGTLMYVFPDAEKYNYVSTTFTESFLGDLSSITEENYYDKVNIMVKRKNIIYLDYLKGIFGLPFGLKYESFFDIEVEHVCDTGQALLNGIIEKEGDIISVNGIRFKDTKYNKLLHDGDVLQALLVYDESSVCDGVITKFVLAGGEIDE